MQSNQMTPEDPHLFFAEISLDISRGEHELALQRLTPLISHFDGSYLFTLLLARAHKGTGNLPQAFDLLKKCCALAPANQIAKKELVALYSSLQTSSHTSRTSPDQEEAAPDPLTIELEELSAALMQFQPSLDSETAEPTTLAEQKIPFADDEAIEVPTESLARLFSKQGALKKSIKTYTMLIQLNPTRAEHYRQQIDELLERL
ncbi:hypothetical protein [Chlorobium phaeovibrioides]|nr:hypothetical protein [Chlorobium phaeovibrioides]